MQQGDPIQTAKLDASVDQGAFSERLGHNARYVAIGNAAAAGVMRVRAYSLGHSAVFLSAAILPLPALVVLASLREADSSRLQPHRTASPRDPSRPRARSWQFLTDRRLRAFAVCAVLFRLANAAMLPIAAAAVTKRAESEAGLIIAACIVGPQLITALPSPWAGRAAEAWGRYSSQVTESQEVARRPELLAMVVRPELAHNSAMNRRSPEDPSWR